MSLARFRSNLPILASALCFFILQAKTDSDFLETDTDSYLFGIPIAVIALGCLLAFVPSFFSKFKSASKPVLAFCGLNALGVAYAGKLSLVDYLTHSRVVQSAFGSLVDNYALVNAVSWLLAIASLLAIFAWTFYVISFLIDYVRDTNLVASLTKTETATYLVLFIGVTILTTAAYFTSNAYYAAVNPYNVIYSTDSGSIFLRDTFLLIAQSQNDIRQPLFGVFALPFFGLPYLLSWLTPNEILAKALLYNLLQNAMLIVSFGLISQVLGMNDKRRALFVTACAFTFMFLLYALAMEQYVVVFFWTAITVHSLAADNPKVELIVASAGTLLTGAWLSLFYSRSLSLLKRAKGILLCAAAFIVALLAFGRFQIIVTLSNQLHYMSSMSGTKLPLDDKVSQFFNFVSNCFFFPPSLERDVFGYPSWWSQQSEIALVVGVVIFALCCISAFVNRESRFARIAFSWMILSMIALIGLGWGASEHCLVLYTLYFGWAYAGLLVMLLDKLSIGLNAPILFYAPIAVAIIAMALIDAQSLAAMFEFANTVYPRI